MDSAKNFDRQSRQYEREQRRRASQEKWSKRERHFWKTFLFTEEGKPKSSLWIYTFCLSFLFLAFYIISFGLLIDVLQPLVQSFPVMMGNLVSSLICSIVGLLPCGLIHHFSKDKRLAFGGHLWLGVYALAALVTVMVILWDNGEAIRQFLQFFTWFFLIPVLIGGAGTFWLYHRDYKVRREYSGPVMKRGHTK